MASLKKKVAGFVSCPTCAAISAVLAAAKVPSAVRNEIAFDNRIRGIDSKVKGNVKRAVAKKVVRPLTKQAKKRAKILSQELKAANKRARKKSGGLKKGWSQSRIMKEAHKKAQRRY